MQPEPHLRTFGNRQQLRLTPLPDAICSPRTFFSVLPGKRKRRSRRAACFSNGIPCRKWCVLRHSATPCPFSQEHAVLRVSVHPRGGAVGGWRCFVAGSNDADTPWCRKPRAGGGHRVSTRRGAEGLPVCPAEPPPHPPGLGHSSFPNSWQTIVYHRSNLRDKIPNDFEYFSRVY